MVVVGAGDAVLSKLRSEIVRNNAYMKALLVGSLFALPAGLMLIYELSWPNADLLQPNRFYLGTDFINYWSGGRLALGGRVDIIYDVPAYAKLLKSWFLPELRPVNFSYPPHSLLFFMAPGALPYLSGLVLWSFYGAVAFGAVALGRRPQHGDAPIVWAIILAPVLWCNVVLGQLGLFLALLFVGALRALPTRPILAGVLIGMLTVKPQFGLLLPLVLILLGAWRTFAAATVTTLLLIGASMALFGVEPWQVYISKTMPFQWQFIELMEGFYRFQMVTPYTVFWFLGFPVKTALALQAMVSVAVALAVIVVVRSKAAWPLKAASVALGSVLMVPYVLAYDLAIPFAALVWYLREQDTPVTSFGVGLTGLAWALPFGVGTLVQTQGVPLLPVVLIVCFCWLTARALSWRWNFARRRVATAQLA